MLALMAGGIALTAMLVGVGVSEERIAAWIANVPMEIEHVPHEGCRTPSIDALIAAGPCAVPQLKQQLNSQNGAMVHGVIYILGRIGPPARDAVPELKKLAKATAANPYGNAGYAFDALTLIAPRDQELLDVAEQLARENIYSAVEYIREQGPAAQPVVQRLVTTMAEPRVELLQAYVDNGGDFNEIEGHLMRGVCGDDSGLKQWALGALDADSKAMLALVDKWRSNLADVKEPWRLFVLDKLWLLWPATQPDIQYWLASGTFDERKEVVGCCNRLQEKALPLLDDLKAATEDCGSLAPDVTHVLLNLGDPGTKALAELAVMDLLNTSVYAMKALRTQAAEIGPEVVELMWDLLVTTQKSARLEAYYFFTDNTDYSAEIEQLLPRFEELLDNEDECFVQLVHVIIVKRRYGPAGELDGSSMQAMYKQAASEDPNPRVRELAGEWVAEYGR